MGDAQHTPLSRKTSKSPFLKPCPKLPQASGLLPAHPCSPKPNKHEPPTKPTNLFSGFVEVDSTLQVLPAPFCLGRASQLFPWPPGPPHHARRGSPVPYCPVFPCSVPSHPGTHTFSRWHSCRRLSELQTPNTFTRKAVFMYNLGPWLIVSSESSPHSPTLSLFSPRDKVNPPQYSAPLAASF